MTTEQKVQILAVITTTSEAGKHFTEVFDYDDLSALEEEGLMLSLIHIFEPTRPY